jgi:Holliday junction resolvase
LGAVAINVENSMNRVQTTRKGKVGERRCVEALEADGYIAYQTHLSRGPFDVIAIRKDGIRFIQVKVTRNKERGKWGISRKSMREFAAHIPRGAIMELWVWVDRNGWQKEIIEKV